MVKIIVLLFACLALAAVAESNPIHNEQESPASLDHVSNETQVRPKRQIDGLFRSIGDMVSVIIHESMVHKQQQYQNYPQQRYYNSDINYIGNGKGNTNHITYNIYNNNRRQPYYK